MPAAALAIAENGVEMLGDIGIDFGCFTRLQALAVTSTAAASHLERASVFASGGL
jgi:hypothetical protein